MAKLTLSVDSRVIARARQYAKRRGGSISEMVEAYLTAVSDPRSPDTHAAPILRSLRGVLKDGNIDDYRKHLATKHR